MPVSNSNAILIRIAWLKKNDYHVFRVLLRHGLPPTYEAWERRTKTMITRITRQGGNVVKVGVAPEEFVVWCGHQHRDVSWISLQLFIDTRIGEDIRNFVCEMDQEQDTEADKPG
ncbi:hypothetical protein BLA18110_07954 [Burkholderia lata]|uniref:hypothetical protein n=1 Tax=Burkholderia lata (strain ATCC 17760 / DSM 23089 / LMG 22485 / NCIMB 9086 / R18194 / 383) TaxID=482957 RepID=UPI001453594A|nr:hypothetical protein [Burkholderia lata]VWD54536.1 hypothetical protein BLA18110_07954 [Burkholderia lata]